MAEKVIWGTPPPDGRRGDLHLHSKWRKGTLATDGTSTPRERLEQALAKGHDFVGLLDHDNIGPSVEAFEIADKENLPIEVPYGTAEVSCKVPVVKRSRIEQRDAHILAYRLSDNIPFNLSVVEAVRAIHRQNGFAVAAHPLCRYAHGVGKKGLLEVATSEDPEIYWDGVEGFNGLVHDWRFALWPYEFKNPNKDMIKLYDSKKDDPEIRFGIMTLGSDDHNGAVGRAFTVVPKGITIFQAFEEGVETAGIFTGGSGDYSVSGIREQIQAGRLLAVERALTGDAQVFPN